MRFFTNTLSVFSALFLSGAAFAQDVMIVFDASNSMWGQIDKVAKIETAKDVFGTVLDGMPETAAIGLMAFGHRERGQCSDIEVLANPTVGQSARLNELVQDITPKGKTPISDAIQQAADVLNISENKATVILISDGIESCDRDPCTLAKSLKTNGIDFTAHVVGFGIGADVDTSSLACIANETGGIFKTADDAAALNDALKEVGETVSQQAIAPELPPLEPIVLTAPMTSVIGTDFAVSWDKTIQPTDVVRFVGDGDLSMLVVGQDLDGTLTAPANAGRYTIQYVGRDKTVLGEAVIEVLETDIIIATGSTAIGGSDMRVEVFIAPSPRDTIRIVPKGAPDDTLPDASNRGRVESRDAVMVQAPRDAGEYEVRYVLDEGGRVLARLPLTVTDGASVLGAPETAMAGSRINVTFSKIISDKDFIAIVPKGADEDDISSRQRVKESGNVDIVVPLELGAYEVRYIISENKSVLERRDLIATQPSVTLSAPSSATAGDKIIVTWDRALNPSDFITIVPVGSPAKTRKHSNRAKGDSTKINVPKEAGQYEIRYLLVHDPVVITSLPLTVR
jgi:Ca-activated chloride channel family protein